MSTSKIVRCTEVGRGSKGSLFTCTTPSGDIDIKAVKIAPYKYKVFSTHPRRYEAEIYAPNRRKLRERIEDWLSYTLGKK